MSVDPLLISFVVVCYMQYLYTNCVTSNNALRMWNLSILLTEVAGSCERKYTSAILVYVTSTKTATFTSALLQISVHFTNLVWI